MYKCYNNWYWIYIFEDLSWTERRIRTRFPQLRSARKESVRLEFTITTKKFNVKMLGTYDQSRTVLKLKSKKSSSEKKIPENIYRKGREDVSKVTEAEMLCQD